MTTSSTPVRIVEETPAYWRVLFDNPPLNVVDASVFEGLQDLLARMDASPNLRVVVFESANPEFYLAHFDLTGKTGEHHHNCRAFRPPDPDGYFRPSHQVPGGQHREDPRLRPGREQRIRPCLRHALRVAREDATGSTRSRGGSASRRWRHGTPPTVVGRGRALEIVLGANDFDGDTAERYGYVNRALPDGSWTVSSMCSRAASPPSIGVPIATAKDLSTRSRCHPSTDFSTPATPLRPR